MCTARLEQVAFDHARAWGPLNQQLFGRVDEDVNRLPWDQRDSCAGLIGGGGQHFEEHIHDARVNALHVGADEVALGAGEGLDANQAQRELRGDAASTARDGAGGVVGGSG